MTFALLPLAMALALASAGAAGTLRVQALARALQPGELVRVMVEADAPLEEASASFGDQDVTLVASDEQRRSWSGWAVIPLDAKPAEVGLTARGRAHTGALAASTTVDVAAKAFPEQRLKVADSYVNPPKAVQDRIAAENRRLGEIYARRTPVPPPSAPFVRPVPGEPTGVFGARRYFNDQARKPHAGLDLRAATGTPVKAAGPGSVVLAEDLYFSGNTVILDHGAGLFTVYAHLSRMDVEVGAEVEAGRLVGLAGATGRVTGPHLHWGGKVGNVIFDPTGLLDPALFPPAPEAAPGS